MILKKEHDYLTLPEMVDERTCALVIYPKGNPEKVPDSYGIQVHQMSFNELVLVKAKFENKSGIVVGLPVKFAIDCVEGKSRLFVWPSPAEDTFARFRYCPAMKEI